MPQVLSVNGKDYSILKLLGSGKGGYSYLAEREGSRVVIKQIHHEPCDYYQFGNKIEAEIRDYDRLQRIGIPLPEVIDVDKDNERIIKEYIDGDTVYEMVLEDRLPDTCLEQMKAMYGRPALCREYKYRLLPDKFYPAGRHAVLCGLRVQ